ncbi:class I SAM-dependent methyltransferase [Candidatus Uhrbacteria bacterium]|nr:class I SAM-dependent methyltransferase [Candidatus Uhrbacteria bacterium]
MSDLGVLWLGCAFVLIGIAGFLWYSSMKGAPWFPTTKRTRQQMLDIAKLAPGELLLDLGAGDGRMVIDAARRGARAVGYEVNPLLARIARWRVGRAKLADRVRIEHVDLFAAALPPADVVTLFLLQDTNQRVRDEILPRLTQGTRVVSYAFTFRGIEPTRVLRPLRGPAIYLYQR